MSDQMALGILLLIAAAVWAATARTHRKPLRPYYDVKPPRKPWPKR